MLDDAVRDVDPVGERGLETGELDPVVDLQHEQPASPIDRTTVTILFASGVAGSRSEDRQPHPTERFTARRQMIWSKNRPKKGDRRADPHSDDC